MGRAPSVMTTSCRPPHSVTLGVEPEPNPRRPTYHGMSRSWYCAAHFREKRRVAGSRSTRMSSRCVARKTACPAEERELETSAGMPEAVWSSTRSASCSRKSPSGSRRTAMSTPFLEPATTVPSSSTVRPTRWSCSCSASFSALRVAGSACSPVWIMFHPAASLPRRTKRATLFSIVVKKPFSVPLEATKAYEPVFLERGKRWLVGRVDNKRDPAGREASITTNTHNSARATRLWMDPTTPIEITPPPPPPPHKSTHGPWKRVLRPWSKVARQSPHPTPPHPTPPPPHKSTHGPWKRVLRPWSKVARRWRPEAPKSCRYTTTFPIVDVHRRVSVSDTRSVMTDTALASLTAVGRGYHAGGGGWFDSGGEGGGASIHIVHAIK